MLKTAMDIIIIVFLSIGAISHFLKLFYLVFRPKVLEKIEFIANETPSRTALGLYYLLTVLVCIYSVLYKFEML